MSKLAAAFAAVCTILFTVVPAHAQEFSLHFDAAHIVGSGQCILVHRVPVVEPLRDGGEPPVVQVAQPA